MTCRITKMCRQIFRQYRDDAGIVPYAKNRICTDSQNSYGQILKNMLY